MFFLLGNDINSHTDVNNTKVRLTAEGLLIPAVDKNSCATSRIAAFDVSPPIADHIASGKAYLVIGCGAVEQTWFRLPAIAKVGVIVATHVEAFDSEYL